MTDIMTPALGESVTEATVAHWSKKAGDAVKRDDVLVELETDKVSLEVVALADGILSAIEAEEGATVVPGQRLGQLGNGGGVSSTPQVKAEAPPAAPASVSSPAAPPAAAKAPEPTSKSSAPHQNLPLAPSVQRIVTENGLDPTKIIGGGKDGRITKGDALAALESRAASPFIRSAGPGPRNP